MLTAVVTSLRPAAPARVARPCSTMSVKNSFLERTEGEWAGYQCDFSANGELRPVNDRYLSEEAIDYGMRPAGFELLTTERVVGGDLHRRFLRMLPADGCASDNLSAEVSASCTVSRVLDERLAGDERRGVFTLDDPPGEGGDYWYLRTFFETGPPRSASNRAAPPNVSYRTRLSLRWDPVGMLVRGKCVTMAIERRWADVGALDQELTQGGASLKPGSTGATGCDASFVDGAIGARCFASLTPIAQKDGLLQLPGGVVIHVAPRASGWTLDVRLSAVQGQMKVVRREFSAEGALEATLFA